jgi:hypothetical protein
VFGFVAFRSHDTQPEELGFNSNRLNATFFNNLTEKQAAALTKYGNFLSKSRESGVNNGGVVVDDFATLTLPDNIEIYAYDGPGGKTYQVILYTATTTQSWAFGGDPAMIAAKTYLVTGVEYSDKSASTTP